MRGSPRGAAWALAAAAALLLLVASALASARGGLAGVYSFVGAQGQEIEVLRRVDPRIDFPVPQRIDAAYIFHWDLKRFGFPTEMPAYAIHWRGLLSVPESGTYGFSVDSQGEAAFSLDGTPLEIRKDAITERPLTAGLHPIALDYSLTSGEAHLVLSWRPPGRRLDPIPDRFLAADRAALLVRRGRRAWGVSLLLAGALSAALLFLAARRRPEGAAGKILQAAWDDRGRLGVAAIVLLAALLRFHDYALVPFHHETADEYQHAWEGWHLLHEGFPAAWSTFPDKYPEAQTRDFRWFGDRYHLVQPYFDHPPLFSIPVGLVCTLAGAGSFLECTLPAMRLVPILLSLLGIPLLVRLARSYGASERAALLAALVYATLPVIILGHRLVKAESLLSLLFMGALILVREQDRRSPRRAALWAGVLGGLAILTKATGVVVPVAVLLLLMSAKRWRDAALVAGIAAGSVVLYVLYAWRYDLGIFLSVLRSQSTSKWVSLEAIPDLLSGKAVVKFFGRGSYLFLLLAGGVAAFRKERALLLPPVLYATILALTADHRVVYGWYRIPLFPFLCVAAGLYLEAMLEEADLPRAFPFAATAVATGLLYALPEPLASSRTLMVGFAALALLPFLPLLVQEAPWARRLARGGAFVLLSVFLLTSVATAGRLLEIYSSTRGVQ
ncbi:MAG TPA: glycosyltransferase family 39 protein [Candidatus Cryosericum sp.]|nr:glycosyltransferase family 39 protein [Candidatus Cryosericum sp.]